MHEKGLFHFVGGGYATAASALGMPRQCGGRRQPPSGGNGGFFRELEASAAYYRDVILTRMEELRLSCDALETMTSAQHWPFPTYGKLLFGIL